MLLVLKYPYKTSFDTNFECFVYDTNMSPWPEPVSPMILILYGLASDLKIVWHGFVMQKSVFMMNVFHNT